MLITTKKLAEELEEIIKSLNFMSEEITKVVNSKVILWTEGHSQNEGTRGLICWNKGLTI